MLMPRSLPFAAALAILLPALPLAAAPVAAPRVPIATLNQLPQPLPLPYDAAANANAAVAAAKARALKGHRKLLIDLGGNWCLDCRLLAGVMDLPSMRGFMRRHYEVVSVDIGRFDKNLDIPARYGIKGRLAGVPALLIVDPKTDRVVNAGRETALADARTLSPQGLADWLAQWA